MDKIGHRDNRIRWIVIGGALLCFAYLAFRISSGTEPAFDIAIRNWVYDHRTPFLNGIFIPVTYMGNWQTIVILGAGLLLVPATRKNIGVPFAVISLSSTVVYKLIKSLFMRPRPELAVRLIEQGGWSFPSGHSMNCIVCYGLLIYLVRRYCKNRRAANGLTALFSLLIGLIGISRVYVGVHFPTDVLGGWSLGAAFLMAAIMILEKLRGKDNDCK